MDAHIAWVYEGDKELILAEKGEKSDSQKGKVHEQDTKLSELEYYENSCKFTMMTPTLNFERVGLRNLKWHVYHRARSLIGYQMM